MNPEDLFHFFCFFLMMIHLEVVTLSLLSTDECRDAPKGVSKTNCGRHSRFRHTRRGQGYMWVKSKSDDYIPLAADIHAITMEFREREREGLAFDRVATYYRTALPAGCRRFNRRNFFFFLPWRLLLYKNLRKKINISCLFFFKQVPPSHTNTQLNPLMHYSWMEEGARFRHKRTMRRLNGLVSLLPAFSTLRRAHYISASPYRHCGSSV